jgi:hypothetical protein
VNHPWRHVAWGNFKTRGMIAPGCTADG